MPTDAEEERAWFSKKLDMADLSNDAKMIAGCWFGRMTPRSDLTLCMEESEPAPRTAAALAELVERQVVSVEPYYNRKGRVYRPLVDCDDAFRWFMKHAQRKEHNFRLMVPITRGDHLPTAGQEDGE